MFNGLEIGRIAGIPIYLDMFFVLLLLLFTYPYFTGGSTQAMSAGFVIIVGILLSILLHELGHAFAGRPFKAHVSHIELTGLGGIAQSATVGEEIRLSPALIQPIASADVAAALADVAVAPPANGTVEVAGPEAMPLDELVRRFLRATQDTRKVVPDVRARYFGGFLSDRTLTPGENPRIGAIRFEDWLGQSTAQARR